jgi:hypothetical protein
MCFSRKKYEFWGIIYEKNLYLKEGENKCVTKKMVILSHRDYTDTENLVI